MWRESGGEQLLGLEILYNSEDDFKLAALDYAAEFTGSDSMAFAEEWLLHDHVTQNDEARQSNASEKQGDAFTDSREKLEADVLKFSQVYYTSHLLVYDKVIELLDRQAAITADEWERALDVVKAERDNLADDLLACNREREHLREQLGIALDHAHDVLALVDLDGEVVS